MSASQSWGDWIACPEQVLHSEHSESAALREDRVEWRRERAGISAARPPTVKALPAIRARHVDWRDPTRLIAARVEHRVVLT
jgi:hypothetical protein